MLRIVSIAKDNLRRKLTVVELLVWLALALWVTDLGHQVVFLLEDEISNAFEVSVLQIRVKVDLNDTVGNSIGELLLG